jgi:hypothetical protein
VNTLTLFNAYEKAQNDLSNVCVLLAAVPMSAGEIASNYQRARRLERQCNTLAAAIRARLTPPHSKQSRVAGVSIHPNAVFVHRNNEDDYAMYAGTTASRKRLFCVCVDTMHPTWSGIAGVMRFEREVKS